MTKEEGQEFKKRWELTNAAVLEELRRATPEERLGQLAVLFGSPGGSDKDEERVRLLWIRLKEKARV